MAGCLTAQSGFVRSGGQPIPGAAVTVTQNGQTQATTTDKDGHYGFYEVGPGHCSVTVEMFGFETLKKDVDFSAAKGPVNFEIQLKPSQALQRMQQFAQRGGVAAGGAGAGHAGGPTAGTGRARAGNSAQDQELENAMNAGDPSAVATPSTNSGGNEAFLISGSLSPGMAQGAQADSGPDMRFGPGGPGGPAGPDGQFGGAANGGGAPGFGGAQGGGGGFGGGGFGGPGGGFGGAGRGGPGGFGGARGPGGPRNQVAGAQFGNGRRRQQQIRGQASFTLQNSALNAKPFSLNGLDIPQAAYAQTRFSLIVGGPLVIGKLKDPKTQFFLTYFGTRTKSPQLFAENVPTEAERNGHFSQLTSLIYNPATHQPFADNQIPIGMLNPISLALLKFYPLPNQLGTANNYQFETAQASNTDNLGFRLQRSVTAKDRLSENFQYQRRDGTSANAFGWADPSSGYGINVTLGWTRNVAAELISNFQIRFNRNRSEATPYFSTLPDVAQQLGIPGTSSNPLNYGPPTLNFTNFGALTDGVASLTRNQSQGFTESINWVKGEHNFTFGAGYTRPDLSTKTDPNGRGTLNFTGVATSALSATGQVVTSTGFDLADFLLGAPQSSSIQYGEQTNYFQQNQVNGYAQDEWKARSNLTLILGVRYEYFGPIQEKYGRIANLAIGPDFSSATVVTPATPGEPSALIHGDYKDFSPRLAVAYKVPGSKKSTIIRAGYGIYYNGQIYNSFIQQLAKQPPFAVASALNTSTGNPLSYFNAFQSAITQTGTNTYAVDPNYRTPYAGSWNFSVQKELGRGFFADLTYLGTKGTRLDVKIIPNEAPPGSKASLAQSTLYTYEESNGDSIFHALQLRVNRRFNRGLSFQAFYQFAKSIDDSSSFGGAGNTTAQNWLDLSAERGLSSFDMRHQFTLGFVWTSPIAGPGSHVASDGKVGRLLKDWQISGNMTAQTGNPFTARVLGNTQQLAQTGGIGSGRASATGEPIDEGSGFFNLAAFTAPASGTYGDAGRNTIPGPDLISLNAALARSFTFKERRRVEFRVETNNLLNQVNYTNFYTVVNAVNYGLPSSASGMRTVQAVVRLRF